MRRGLVLALAACVLAGCLEVKATTRIEKNGSGTYKQVTTIAMEKAKGYIAQLKAQARGLGIPADDDGMGPFEAVDAKKRKAALATRKGIRVTKSTQSEDKKKKTRTYELAVAFDSLKQLYEAGVVEDVNVKLERVRDGKAWTLTIKHVFDGSDREPLRKEDAARLKRMRKAMLDRYKPWWGSMAIESTLTLPTRVMATNGQPLRTETGNHVTWRITFGDLVDDELLEQRVTFLHVEGLKLEPFELTANDIANAVEEAELAAEEAAKKKKKKKKTKKAPKK